VEKVISVSLYDQVVNEPNADELAECILLNFADERGAYKRTYGKRFENFDQKVLEIIERELPSKTRALRLLDTGVSDGRTSVDFFHKLAKCYPKLTYFASDYDPEVQVISSGNVSLTLSSAGKLVEISWPPFVFNVIRGDHWHRYPLNRLIRLFVQPLIAKKILKQYETGALKPRTVSLFCPKAQRLSQEDKRFKLMKYSLLDASPIGGKVDLIRAMNVLNPSYFSKQAIKKIVGNIFNSLSEGGLFITGSNQESDSPVNGGIYRKTATHFELLWQSGTGSPIQDTIKLFRQDSAPKKKRIT